VLTRIRLPVRRKGMIQISIRALFCVHTCDSDDYQLD